MKRFIKKVRKFGEKASELRSAMEKVPPKMAEFKEALAMTTGQLKSLRSDFESTVNDLKADNDDGILNALAEIRENSEVFLEAGFELGGIDMEVSPIQRLKVHLNRLEDVREDTLQHLLKANRKRKTIHALLSSLIRAEEMADKVDMDNLNYSKLIIHVGPVPMIRLCWRSEEIFEESSDPTSDSAPPPLPSASSSSSSSSSAANRLSYHSYGKNSFFEKRSPATPQSEPDPSELTKTAEPAAPHQEEKVVPPTKSAWSKDSLERFKQMPHISKYK